MPDQPPIGNDPNQSDAPQQSAPAQGTSTRPSPAKPKHQPMPPWRVLLHNDDDNTIDYVVDTILMLTPLNELTATSVTYAAHLRGQSLLLTTHKERAELYQQQFTSRGLTVTIEPA